MVFIPPRKRLPWESVEGNKASAFSQQKQNENKTTEWKGDPKTNIRGSPILTVPFSPKIATVADELLRGGRDHSRSSNIWSLLCAPAQSVPEPARQERCWNELATGTQTSGVSYCFEWNNKTYVDIDTSRYFENFTLLVLEGKHCMLGFLRIEIARSSTVLIWWKRQKYLLEVMYVSG